MAKAASAVASSSDSRPAKRQKITDASNTRIQGQQIKSNVEVQKDSGDEVPVKVKKMKKSKTAPVAEKRLKRFREKAPGTWLERLERAITQRMFVLNRERSEVNGCPRESVELAGSTGNVYTITIKQIPSCTCPDGSKGNICKHIIYVLRLVLKAPPTLEYQMAFLTDELELIFNAAPLPVVSAESSNEDETNRKAIEGDCPICFMEFQPATEEIVWCKTACGNNIHKQCFEQWAKSAAGREVTCVYCRSHWEGDEPSLEKIRAVKDNREVNGEGYVNLSSDLGISAQRDTSTYHQFWVRRQERQGYDFNTE